jgi:hypothetical protein
LIIFVIIDDIIEIEKIIAKIGNDSSNSSIRRGEEKDKYITI